MGRNNMFKKLSLNIRIKKANKLKARCKNVKVKGEKWYVEKFDSRVAGGGMLEYTMTNMITYNVYTIGSDYYIHQKYINISKRKYEELYNEVKKKGRRR